MARKKKSSLKVDFSEVTSVKVPEEGNYLVKVDSAELNEGSKGPYIAWVFEITQGEFKGSKLFHNTSLSPQALFSLKGLLESLGLKVPKGELDLDLSQYEGLTAEVSVAPEVYEGKKRARIVEFISSDSSDLGDDIEEVLEDLDLAELKALAKEIKIKTTRKDDEESIIEKILDAIDEEEVDEDEVFEVIDELFSEEDEDDEDDEEEDEDDEEEDEIDYDSMSLKDLKAEARSRGLKVTKGMKKDDIVEALEEDDEE